MRQAILGIRRAAGARPGLFAAVALAVVALDLLLPVAVLSVARKPWDYFAFNAWLPSLPAYLASDAPLPRKLEFLWGLALFWFVADGPFGAPEWGFAVSVGDLVRMAATAVLFGAYFALWAHGRDLARAGACPAPPAWRAGGVTGAVGSVLGLSTAPCGVVGCGAPVLPVVGLAFEGLSSGTLALMAGVSRWTTALLLVAVTAAVLVLGRRLALTAPSAGRASRPARPGDAPSSAPRTAAGRRPACGRRG